jgi:hypothetical protein
MMPKALFYAFSFVSKNIQARGVTAYPAQKEGLDGEPRATVIEPQHLRRMQSADSILRHKFTHPVKLLSLLSFRRYYRQLGKAGKIRASLCANYRQEINVGW